MAVYGSPATEKKRHVMHDGKVTFQTQIIHSNDPVEPHAFLVEQTPGCIIRPHFHDTSQFQVAVAGEATINGHAFLPITVHYARRQTGYGPIVAGDKGFSYLTLRPWRDTGPNWIPEDMKNADRKAKRRQVTSQSLAAIDGSSSRPRVDLIEPDQSGLASWVVRAAAGETAIIDANQDCGGRYVVVLGGSAVAGSSELPELGSVWLPRDEDDFSMTAGPSGVEFIVLQFPVDVIEEEATHAASHAH